MGFQIVRQISVFPGKTTLGVRRAAEMAIGGDAGVNLTVKLKIFTDAARGKGHPIEKGRLEFFFRNLDRAVRMDRAAIG